MDLVELRDRVLSRVQRANTTFAPLDVDYAIQAGLNELDLDSYFSLVYTDTATMTVNNAEVGISALVPSGISDVLTTGIRPERVIRVELAYTDRGTWSASSVSYAVNDIVKGDGSPDSYYYVCKEAHTSSSSNQPGDTGGSTYWTRRQWQHGNKLELVNRDTIARWLGDSPNMSPYLPANYVSVVNLNVTPSEPTHCAFLTQDTLLVWPPPDKAYKVRMLIQYPLTEWEAGQSADVTIAIPNNILLPAIDGMCYWLDPQHPNANTWRQRFDIHIRKAAGMSIVDAGPSIRDPRAYMDVTDGWPYGRYGLPFGWTP